MVTKLLPLEICSTSIMEKVYKHELLEKFISKKEITESLNRGMIKMAKKNSIKLFEDKLVRSVWDEEKEEWYFSIVDVVEILTDSSDPKQYIKKMRSRDDELNSNWGTICTPLQMIGKDGKRREIQAANTQGLFRIIQSIPSKKAEPFKQWLAKAGAERLDQLQYPELSIKQGLEDYRRLGYSDDWINQRLKSIEIRKDLTDQ